MRQAFAVEKQIPRFTKDDKPQGWEADAEVAVFAAQRR